RMPSRGLLRPVQPVQLLDNRVCNRRKAGAWSPPAQLRGSACAPASTRQKQMQRDRQSRRGLACPPGQRGIQWQCRGRPEAHAANQAPTGELDLIDWALVVWMLAKQNPAGG